MRNCLVIMLTASLVLLASCAHQRQWANVIDWEELDFRNLPTRADYPDAGAIVLLDEGKMKILGDDNIGLSIFTHHRILKILNARGRRFLNMAVPYHPGASVDKIVARTISPDGRITVLKKDNIFDITFYPNFVFYSDRRAKLFTLPAVEDGSVIEYEYQISIDENTFWHSWEFQNDVPTQISRFTLVNPSEWDVNYRVYNLDIEPWIDENPGSFDDTYVWEARNVPPPKREFGMPPERETTIRLALSPAGVTSWNEIAEWYALLSESRMTAGPGIKALVAEMTANIEEDEEKLRRIYEWVRDSVRYIAVEIGVGGFQPHAAEEIFTNRYGDCKDMTTLLCTMARKAGIAAYPVLVSTRQAGMPDTSLVSQLQFNHAIAYSPDAGEGGVWMDATAKGCRFGQLPWYDQGLSVLVVEPDGVGEIKETPRDSPEENKRILEWAVSLDSLGNGRVNGVERFWGGRAAEIREQLMISSPDGHRSWIESSITDRCSGVALDTFTIDHLEPSDEPVTIRYAFDATMFATPMDSVLVLHPGSISTFDLPDYFRPGVRVHPVRFAYGSWYELNINVDLPSGWVMHTPAYRQAVPSPFGSAFWEGEFEENTYSCRMVYLVEDEDVMPEDYPRFREFLDHIRRGDLREVIFRRNKKD